MVYISSFKLNDVSYICQRLSTDLLHWCHEVWLLWEIRIFNSSHITFFCFQFYSYYVYLHLLSAT